MESPVSTSADSPPYPFSSDSTEPILHSMSLNGHSAGYTNGNGHTPNPLHISRFQHRTYSHLPSHADFPIYLRPGGDFALSGIAVRSAFLGTSFGISTVVSIYLWWTSGQREEGSWLTYFQLPAFMALLSLFHFLEFWVTAEYNPRRAEVDAFLLSSNGTAYNIAHLMAFLESSITLLFFPRSSTKLHHTPSILLGFVLIIMGQTCRTLAMMHAGASFSHQLAYEREQDHMLVTRGVYGWLRHPSYFGFYWWAVGTQVMMGNWGCAVGYTAVLWLFFSRRIRKEEALLTKFFGDRYVEYRRKTRVGIPFIP